MYRGMNYALTEARKAGARGEVPVGAALMRSSSLVIAEGNRMREGKDPTLHAEMLVLKKAFQCLGRPCHDRPSLEGYDLYVTLEPCTMCAAALSLARIDRVIFGAYDEKGGGIEHGARFFYRRTCHHVPQVIGGVKEPVCEQLLRHFFEELRHMS